MLLIAGLLCSSAQAADKLIVVDKIATTGKAKVVFVARGGGVTKGRGTAVEEIGARFYFAYSYSSVAGAFLLPPGAGNGWVTNGATLAKFRNYDAPAGSSQAKVAIIKPGRIVKLVAKGLGDLPFDIKQESPLFGAVDTAYCVDNGGTTHCGCGGFSLCTYKTIAAGTGTKLVCKHHGGGGGSDWCLARCQAGDGICSPWCGGLDGDCGGCFVDQGQTITSACHGLEWEKKTASDGIANPADLNDVDNRYSWAGRCTISTSLCQPTAPAETACLLQTASSSCYRCGPAEGTCDVDPMAEGAITTVWDWLSQLNAMPFAGHADWRLPELDSQYIFLGDDVAQEMESIVDPTAASCGFGGPCVDPAFSPTADVLYWSVFRGLGLWYVPRHIESRFPDTAQAVRAVRSLP